MSTEMTTTLSARNTDIVRGGKTVGQRYDFVGACGAGNLREQAKSSGLKGKSVTEWVNARLSGDEAIAARMVSAAWLEAAQSAGYVPTVGEFRKNSAVLRLQRPSKDAKAEKLKEVELELAETRAMLAELKAKLGL